MGVTPTHSFAHCVECLFTSNLQTDSIVQAVHCVISSLFSLSTGATSACVFLSGSNLSTLPAAPRPSNPPANPPRSYTRLPLVSGLSCAERETADGYILRRCESAAACLYRPEPHLSVRPQRIIHYRQEQHPAFPCG